MRSEHALALERRVRAEVALQRLLAQARRTASARMYAARMFAARLPLVRSARVVPSAGAPMAPPIRSV